MTGRVFAAVTGTCQPRGSTTPVFVRMGWRAPAESETDSVDSAGVGEAGSGCVLTPKMVWPGASRSGRRSGAGAGATVGGCPAMDSDASPAPGSASLPVRLRLVGGLSAAAVAAAFALSAERIPPSSATIRAAASRPGRSVPEEGVPRASPSASASRFAPTRPASNSGNSEPIATAPSVHGDASAAGREGVPDANGGRS